MSRTGQKHLITCQCVLERFEKLSTPPLHKFVVFSIIENDRVLPKLVQCNNCGIIHDVIDLCKSKMLMGVEHSTSLVTTDEVGASLSPKICAVLEKNDADLASWEAAQFIIENERWGDIVVLTSELVHDGHRGKILRILSNDMIKIEQFDRKETV